MNLLIPNICVVDIHSRTAKSHQIAVADYLIYLVTRVPNTGIKPHVFHIEQFGH